jgi:hypothetical protein
MDCSPLPSTVGTIAMGDLLKVGTVVWLAQSQKGDANWLQLLPIEVELLRRKRTRFPLTTQRFVAWNLLAYIL